MKEILCSIATRGRYDTTLPLALASIINQTKLPDHIIIFDDNDEDKRIDLREKEVYRNLLLMIELKGITWQVIFGERKGPQYNHQIANTFGYKWVLRVDDDTILEPNVLQTLYNKATTEENVGAVGGCIITPWWNFSVEERNKSSNKIEDIYSTPNKQWFPIIDTEEVDHLHCSFLYRAGVCDYNLQLSPKGFREETLFTYEFIKRGYKNFIIPCKTWHLKASEGGIRGVNDEEMYIYDEEIFRKNIDCGKLCVLNNGIGDHLVFESILPELINKYKKLTLAVCYPDVFEDYNIPLISIADAEKITNIDRYNIYKFMADRNWKNSLQEAYKTLYL